MCRVRDGFELNQRFPKENVECVHAVSDRLAFSTRISEDRTRLVMADLESQDIIEFKDVNRTLQFAALGTDAFVWIDSTVGLRVGRANAISSSEDLVLPMSNEPTCIDVWRCDSQEYVVAAGDGNGRILVWKIALCAGSCSSEKILESNAHQGEVTTIAFTSRSRLASGGSDRVIALTRILGIENLNGAEERRLQRSLRCRGMRIAGIKGPTEFELLKGFLARFEDEGM